MTVIVKLHPVTSLFPEMSEDDFLTLKEDIREHGQMEPIWLSADGRIIDGRHRYKACRELHIEPAYSKTKYEDDATLSNVVISLNLKRRHLNESQRSMIAARLKHIYEGEAEKRMKSGKLADPTANLQQGTVTKQAADKLKVVSVACFMPKRSLKTL